MTLVLLIVPSLVQVTFKIELPTVLEILILVFIFSAEILGEIQEYYIIIPMWDTVLHTINGFLAGRSRIFHGELLLTGVRRRCLNYHRCLRRLLLFAFR